MATFNERYGKHRVVIRRKNVNMSATFSTKEMAEIYAKYHEDLIDAMQNFQVKPENYITFEQCMELKLKDLIAKNSDIKTIRDVRNTINYFPEIKGMPFGEITADILRDLSNKMSNTIVKRGGSREHENSGDYRIISKSTLLNRFRYLSVVFSFMIEKGANITNPAQAIVNQIKMSMIKTGEKIED